MQIVLDRADRHVGRAFPDVIDLAALALAELIVVRFGLGAGDRRSVPAPRP